MGLWTVSSSCLQVVPSESQPIIPRVRSSTLNYRQTFGPRNRSVLARWINHQSRLTIFQKTFRYRVGESAADVCATSERKNAIEIVVIFGCDLSTREIYCMHFREIEVSLFPDYKEQKIHSLDTCAYIVSPPQLAEAPIHWKGHNRHTNNSVALARYLMHATFDHF